MKIYIGHYLKKKIKKIWWLLIRIACPGIVELLSSFGFSNNQ